MTAISGAKPIIRSAETHPLTWRLRDDRHGLVEVSSVKQLLEKYV